MGAAFVFMLPVTRWRPALRAAGVKRDAQRSRLNSETYGGGRRCARLGLLGIKYNYPEGATFLFVA